jgi:hypothetical protein
MNMRPIFFAIVLAGCASSGVVPMDRDTYFVKHSAGFGEMGAPLTAKIDVYSDANKYCEMQKKQVEAIKLEMKSQFPFVPGYAALHFRCVNTAQ